MKIVIDTKNNEVKVGSKSFNELPEIKKNITESFIRDFLRKNTKMNTYEEDCMWMSYRYCIGRHTIASHMHAGSIWHNCKNRMSKERQLFTAFDINRQIESNLAFMIPSFHFPLTSLNRIYTSAVDIVCEFMEEYNIKSIEDFIKYRDVHIILTDNERGYKFETITWEEWLRPKVREIVSKYYDLKEITEDTAWNYFLTWRSGQKMKQEEMVNEFNKLTSDMPDPKRYWMLNFEDLFVWNDLVHCFDYEHHHKSILVDDSECEWFWTWTENTEQREDGNYYKAFGYKKIRVPVDKWNGNVTTWIPDEAIKKDIY